MQCTSCKQGKLVHAYLDALFPCHTCEHCGGNFIYLADYLRWIENNKDPKFVCNQDAALHADESERALLCPKTGSLMLKYRISKNTEHRIDLSRAINAIWLDKGEWELLKREGLAGKLNEIFTDVWQRKVRQAKSADVFDALYAEHFGENYEAVKAFRSLLQGMPNKSDVIAYLVSDDPYSV